MTPFAQLRRSTPDWLQRTLTLQPTAVPWHDVVRSGLSLPGPMALGLALGDVPAALYGSLGALLAVLAERSGTTGQRSARIGVAAAGGVGSMLLGRHTAGVGLVPLVCVLAFACVSGILSSIHPMLSFAGMQLLVQMSIAGGLRLDVPLTTLLVWYVGGVVWVMIGVAVQGAIERTATRYRAAVSGIPLMLAEQVGAGDRAFPRTEIAMAEAFAMLAAARPWRRWTRTEQRALSGVLRQMPAMVTAVTAAARSGDDSTRIELDRNLRALAAGIRDRTAAVTATGAAAAAITAVSQAPPAPPGRHLAGTIARRLPNTLRAPATRDYVARVVLCMGVAELVRQHDPAGRGYWVLLTVALILKPDFQPVLARTTQRAVGTLFGAIVATPVLLIPAGWALLPVLAVAASGIPYAVRRNYGLFSVLITPIVLVLLDYVVPTGPAAIGQRIVDTLIGCVIVIVFGYLLWPRTWKPPARDQMAAVLNSLAGWLTADAEWAPERRALYRQLAELEVIAAHAPFEPAPIRRRRQAWTVALHAIADVAAAASAPREARDTEALIAAASQVHEIARAVPLGSPLDETASGPDDLEAAIYRLRIALAGQVHQDVPDLASDSSIATSSPVAEETSAPSTAPQPRPRRR